MRGTAAELTVDLGAIVANFRRIENELGGRSEAAAVVKANAYGLDAEHVAPALARAGCRVFFVAHLEEAVALRPVLPDAEIGVLNGCVRGDEPAFAAHKIIPVLNSLGDVEAWQRFCRSRGAAPAALHVDTGMSRLGLPEDEVKTLIAEPGRLSGVPVRWLMSHLACAEEPENPMNARQLASFDAVRRALPPCPAAFANSSGVFLGRAYHFDLARAGMALYGPNPTPGRPNPMKPVVRLEARILQVRDVDPPGTVGYGAARALTRRTKIATIAIGYADGYPRSLSDRGVCAIAGKRVPVIGRVSMDLVTLDVTDVPFVTAGETAEVIGDTITLDEVAQAAGTISYEILTSLGRRYRRRHIA